MLAHQDGWLTRIRRRSGLPDDSGLRAGAHVRAIDQRTWTLRVVSTCLRWVVIPSWGAATLLMLSRVLRLDSLWTLPGLGITVCSLATGAMLFWGERRTRREMEELQTERFELSEDPVHGEQMAKRPYSSG